MNGELKGKKNSFQFCSPTRKREKVFAIVCSLGHRLLGNVLATFATWRKLLATQYPRFQKNMLIPVLFVILITIKKGRKDVSYFYPLLKGTHYPLCCVMTAMKAGFTVDHNS